MKLLVTLFSVLLLSTLAFSQQATVGVPWTGGKGVTQTVDQIMSRSRAAEAFLPQQPREKRPEREVPMPQRSQNPKAQPVSQYPAADATSVSTVPTSPQVAGTNFLGVVVSESGYIPPDAMGAVGPTQFLIAVNGRIKVFDKAGVLGPLNATIDAFFASALPVATAGVSDPRVRYDRLSGRWIVAAISVDTPNRVVVAVSSSSTISGSGSFTFFYFQHDLVGTTPNADTGGFLDYDAIGVDVNALYVGGNVFNAAGTAFLGTTGFVVRKSSILGAGPIVVTAFRQLAAAGGSGLYTPQGVDNDDPAATQGYFIGVDNAFFSLLQLRRITDPGGIPSISANIPVTVPTTAFPRTVPALGSTRPLDALDDRLFNAQIMNGNLWTAHNINVTSGGVATATGGTTGRNGSRFYELTSLATTPTLVQSGTLFDPTVVTTGTARHTWIPAIGVSGQNHVVITHSIAAPTNSAGTQIQPGVGHGGRLATDPLGTIQSTTITTPGAGNYNIQTTGTQRWGDYSFVSVDPNDNMTLWTAAEYCNANNSWGVRVTQMKAPVPAMPSSLSSPTLNVGVQNVSVTMTGASSSGSGFYDPGSGFPNHVSASVNGGGVTVNSVTYTDPTHLTLDLSVDGNAAPGSRTITVTNPDGQSTTSASGILTIANPCPAITVLPASLPNGTSGLAYSQTITASSGASPYTFAVTSGSIPAGLTLSSGGALSGTPTTTGTSNFSVTATDVNGCTGVQSYSIAISCPTITVSPATLPNGTFGIAYSQTVTASGGSAPYTFAVTAGSLPAGVTLSAGGLLSGNPSSIGSSSFTVTATDANGCVGSQSYSLTIDCPTITVLPSTLPGATTSVPYSQTVTASGGTSPYTFAVTSGTLPTGLSLSSGGNLTGTATATGSFVFTVTATDANGCTGSQGYVITSSSVPCPTIVLTPPTLPDGLFGSAYSQSVGASGGASPYTFAVSTGSLPPGLTLSSGGALTGTPDTSGSYSFTVTATDINGCTGTQSYSMSIVCPMITVSPLTLVNGTAGVAYSQTVTASGGTGPYTFAITAGSLTAGLSLSSVGGLTGTPGVIGNFNFTITATDANGCTGTQSYSIDISCPTITLAPSMLPDGITGVAYNQTISSAGGIGPYTYAVTSGALPTGLSLSTGGGLSGPPTMAGIFSFTVTSTDANGCTGSRADTINIVCPAIVISPPTLPEGEVGALYGQTVTANGGTGPYNFSISADSLPPGLALSAAGNLTGSPTAVGIYAFEVTATDANGCAGTQSYSITIACPTITVGPLTLSDASIGILYGDFAAASGGTPPYTYAVTSGAVPSGLALLPDGNIGGTPDSAGSASFTVTATDANGCTGSASIALSVLASNICVSKYFDANHNQLLDQGETPMPDVTFVLDGDNQSHYEVTTDGTGTACFPGITPGNYSLQEIVPPGYLASYPPSGIMSFSIGAAHDTSVVWLNGAARDSLKYRTATMLEWATATDRKGKLKAEKCAPVSVDFKFLITAPVAATSVKVKLGMLTTGVLTDVTKTITYTSWSGVKEFIYPATIPAGTVLQVQGTGAKGKQIKAKLEWTKAADGRIQRVDVTSYITNIPRLPMPNLHNVGLDLQSQLIFGSAFTIGNPTGTRSVLFLKYSVAQKSLNDGRGLIHDLNPACLADAKIFKNQVKGLSPKKLKNKLFAEALALKLNIAASDQIKFTPGFGDLIYDNQEDTSAGSSALFNGKTVRQILQTVNAFLGCTSGPPEVTADDYVTVLHALNGSFSGAVDTIVWSCSKLQLKGVRALEEVSFLRANPGMLPPEAVPEPVAHDTRPAEFNLEQNYPNPFNPTTTIGFSLPFESVVTLKVYNILGQEVSTLVDNELMDEGTQETEFAADGLPSGIYFYRLTTQEVDEDGALGPLAVQVKKLVLVK